MGRQYYTEILSFLFWICTQTVVKGENVTISPSSPAYAIENNSLTLFCNYSVENPERVYWIKNGEEIATLLFENQSCSVGPGDNSSFNAEPMYQYDCENGVSLTLLRVQERSHGDRWSCGVDNIKSEETTIFVQVPVKYVKFTSPPKDQFAAQERVPVTFKCNTSVERPRSKVTWVFSFEYPVNHVDGTLLDGNNDTLMETSASLIFYPFRAYGKFEVYCIAKNVDSSNPVISNSKIIDVTYPPKVRLQHYHTFLIGEGGRIVLNCTVWSNPVSQCQWAHNRKVLTEINGTEIVYELNNISRNNDGQYVCSCRNELGYDGVETTVRVFWRPQSIILSGSAKNYSVPEGSWIPDITCSADCNPACQIMWQKFDNFDPSAKFPVVGVPTFENYTLSLGHVNRSVAGTYVCAVISFIPGYSPESGVRTYTSDSVKVSVI